MNGINPNEVMNGLNGVLKDLSAKFGDLGKTLEPFENKKKVKLPINGTLTEVAVTKNNVVTIVLNSDTDVQTVLDRLCDRH